mgnify:CR=1 FL=1
MAYRWKNTLTRADTTPYAAYMNRRQLMGGAFGLGLIGAAGVARAEDEALVPNEWDDIPWNGFELADLLNLAGVQEGAKYVAFETALRPDEMPGTRFPVLDWPYVEGLRLDEALHPLTIMATGIYDRPIPNQNGAPMRLVVPWKYGFKSIKSIVRITLTDEEPPTSWNKALGREYGFYSNVNPTVDHPRWSQATERVVGGGLFAGRQDTLMFNGYEDEVASLYEGMDLSVFY